METPYVIYLIAVPGTGKKTVAESLIDSWDESPVVLLDSHTFNDTLFSTITGPPTEAVWDKISQYKNIVFDSIAETRPAQASYILTNYLIERHDETEAFARAAALAETISATFVPVFLTCENLDTHRERFSTPQRQASFKASAPHQLDTLLAKHTAASVEYFLSADPTHCEYCAIAAAPQTTERALTLDTSELSAAEAANVIVEHLGT